MNGSWRYGVGFIDVSCRTQKAIHRAQANACDPIPARRRRCAQRRVRRDPDALFPGDPLDFWHVEAVDLDRLLRLCAEMKVPGRTWLQFEVASTSDGSVVQQTAIFEPRGLAGLLYWYALYPLHSLIFAGMLRGVARAARLAGPAPA
jgi:hypothetical protein